MKTGAFAPLSGEVEADETFLGGKTRATLSNDFGRRLAHGPATGKTMVFGMVQRGTGKGKSRARAMVVPNHKASSLIPRIYENVVPGSTLYTDALRSYRQTDRDFIHEFIDHSIEYVNGRVHTNTIENFWSCVKRTLHGTYIAPFGRFTSTHTSTSRCSGSTPARGTTRIGSSRCCKERTAAV